MCVCVCVCVCVCMCVPDWFLAGVSTLEPALAHRNDLYRRWVISESRADHKAFATAHRDSHLAVRVAKDR